MLRICQTKNVNICRFYLDIFWRVISLHITYQTKLHYSSSIFIHCSHVEAVIPWKPSNCKKFFFAYWIIQQDRRETPFAKYSSNVCIFCFMWLKVGLFQMTAYFVYLVRCFKRSLLFGPKTEEQWNVVTWFAIVSAVLRTRACHVSNVAWTRVCYCLHFKPMSSFGISRVLFWKTKSSKKIHVENMSNE